MYVPWSVKGWDHSVGTARCFCFVEYVDVERDVVDCGKGEGEGDRAVGIVVGYGRNRGDLVEFWLTYGFD